MGRRRRLHLPGGIFHITARTQGKEPWFTPHLRTRVVEYAVDAVGCSDATLLAWAIMPNHLHLVLHQGSWTLERVLQPLLRRTALLVHRSHGVEGHVFERPFDARICRSPRYARNLIVYANLNPVRAGLTEDPATYRWSTHRYFLGRPVPPAMSGALSVDSALRLFAPGEGATVQELRASYRAWVAWRIECDRIRSSLLRGEQEAEFPPPPLTVGGDQCWSTEYAALFDDPAVGIRAGRLGRPTLVELSDIARQVMAEDGAGMALDAVRSSFKSPAYVRVRRAMIRRMHLAGHQGMAIARYLRISPQCVSNVIRQRRA